MLRSPKPFHLFPPLAVASGLLFVQSGRTSRFAHANRGAEPRAIVVSSTDGSEINRPLPLGNSLKDKVSRLEQVFLDPGASSTKAFAREVARATAVSQADR